MHLVVVVVVIVVVVVEEEEEEAAATAAVKVPRERESRPWGSLLLGIAFLAAPSSLLSSFFSFPF